jgi:4-cresol dehydrogenase (hydroxylating) flavoprotein subunit
MTALAATEVQGEHDKVLSCSSVEEVQSLVARANRERLALYPYSTGLNWGYGSGNPVRAGSVRVDLSAMNRIRNADEISMDNPVALVEPGVTQGQLADFLEKHHPGLFFNVTGSARDTSLIGNCLDRGVGYLGPRREDLFALEVVTGRGDVLYTGFRRLGSEAPGGVRSPLAHVHPFGLGPLLDGLFFQGNYGIVTSACFRLLPRPKVQVAVSLALFDAERLHALIDELALLKREAVLGSVTHIGDRARTGATLSHGIDRYLRTHCGLQGDALRHETKRAVEAVAPHEWTALAGVSGSAAQVRAALQIVRQRMRGLAKMTVVSDAKLDVGQRVLHLLRRMPWARANSAAIDAIRPLHGLALGRPTDVAIDNLLWKYGRPDLPARSLEESPCGILFISPALPMQGRFVQDFVASMQAVARRHEQTLYMTLNIETPTAMVAVVNLLFDRRSAQEQESAKVCAAALHELIRVHGLSVYRARADMMSEIVDADSSFWQIARDLKQVLDPNCIMAPGRYNLV